MKKFALYLPDDNRISISIQRETCNKYIEIFNPPDTIEYINFEDLLNNIEMYNNLVIFSFTCLGRRVAEIQAKTDPLKKLNPELNIHFVKEKSYW